MIRLYIRSITLAITQGASKALPLFRRIVLRILDGFWWPPVALLAVVVYWLHRKEAIPLPNPKILSEYGQYGDSFGSLTSLFTALGFGGLIITLAFQQRQIKSQEVAEQRRHQKEAQSHYENVLFRLLDMYRQTLLEVQVGDLSSRLVLKSATDRVEKNIVEENVHCFPSDIQGRFDSKSLTNNDRERIDYLHYRNFKIIAAEINPQGRLVDTFEVLLEHMVHGIPDHVLISTYRDLVFAQITYIECKYYFFVGLSVNSRGKFRELMLRSGFMDRISRSSTHLLHRQMYAQYWGIEFEGRELPKGIPMSRTRIRKAFRAHKKDVGEPKKTYVSVAVRKSIAAELAQSKLKAASGQMMAQQDRPGGDGSYE